MQNSLKLVFSLNHIPINNEESIETNKDKV